MKTFQIEGKDIQARYRGTFWDIVLIDIVTGIIVIENKSLEQKHGLSLSDVELHIIVKD